MFRFCRRYLLMLLMLLVVTLFTPSLRAQTLPTTTATAPATLPTTQPATQPTSQPAFTGPYAIADIISEGDSTLANLQAVDADLASNPVMDSMQQELPLFKNELKARQADTEKVLAASTSLDTIRSIETVWEGSRETLTTWSKQLADRAAELNNTSASQQKITQSWNLERTSGAGIQPPLLSEVTDKINTTLYALGKTNTELERRRAEVLQYQIQVSTLLTQVKTELDHIRNYRDEALDHMLTRDSPPIWEPKSHEFSDNKATRGIHTPFDDQVRAVSIYFERQTGRFLGQGFLIVLLAIGLFWAKARFQSWEETEPSLSAAAPVFVSPLVTTLVLSLVLSIWLHPQAPRLFWSISAAIAIIPAAILIRRLTEPFVYPILYALVGFFFFDQIRSILTGIPHAPRFLFLAEMGCASAFTAWFIYTTRINAADLTPAQVRRHRGIRRVCRLVFVLFFVSFIANAVGFVSLSIFIGSNVLRSAYIGMVLYAGLAVTDGVLIVIMHVRPVNRLRAIKDHGPLIRSRIRWTFSWAAFIFWVISVLNLMLVKEPVFGFFRRLLQANYNNGTPGTSTTAAIAPTISISLGNILYFILAIWASFLISRLLRFLLMEEVYPHVKLPRGVGSAVNSLVHYTLIVLGVAYGAVYLGVSVSSLTILTGAFGVGLGFGLQTIINNFFSGLIVLGERPVQVGDVIEMDGLIGTVTRIGIRASIIRTPTGSEIIMPNGRLIAERVINWTFTDRARGFEIPVTVDNSVDPKTIMKILEDVANAHEKVVNEPAAQARLQSFSAASSTYTLRVWTNEVADWSKVQSDVGLEIRTALAKNNIALK